MTTDLAQRNWLDFCNKTAAMHHAFAAMPDLVQGFRTTSVVGRSGCKYSWELLEETCGMIAEVPIEHVETPEIVCYQPGVEYPWHQDCKHREWTFLLYLNDDYNGGETEFPDGPVKPKAGQLLYWRNAIDGQQIESNRHRVRPVEMGQKWVAVCWVWGRPVQRDLLSGLPPSA